MKKSYFLSLGLLLCFLVFARGNNSIRILNPDWGDTYGQKGTIEEAVFTVEPKGLYMEVGLYLTFSAAETAYSSWDSLEVVLDFDLPAGSIIHDSWLWVGDDIIKADILDIWSAITIYEEIVDRRRDPSVLYKKPGGGYQMRIFPLLKPESRKVKITYLSPAIWTNEKVRTYLPAELLEASITPLSSCKVITFPDPTWSNPSLEELNASGFITGNDPDWGTYFFQNVPGNMVGYPLTFSVDAPLDNNLFFNLWEENGGKFYQMAYLPPELPSTPDPKKIAFLFDHDALTTFISGEKLFDFVVKRMQETLSEQDSFNLIFSAPSSIYALSNNWLPADSATLASYIGTLSNPVVHSFDLVTLIKNGINFIKINGSDGRIMLFASSKKLNPWTSNDKLQEVLDLIGNADINIDIVNYQTKDFDYDWDDPDLIIYNNQQFYKKLTVATSGNFYSTLDGGGSIWEGIRTAFNTLKTDAAIFDLYPNPASGFTYQRYYQSYMGQSFGKNRPVLQTGKLAGDFPINISYTTLTDNGIFAENMTVESGQVVFADTLSREIWTGHYIHSLEGGNPGSNVIHDIINVSIAERVLSNYTAFLALEPSQGGEPCWGCWDYPNVIIINTVEKESENAALLAYPSPFSEKTWIKLTAHGVAMTNLPEIQIFDAFGRLVKILKAYWLAYQDEIMVDWDGTDASGNKLPSGVYHVAVRLNEKTICTKVVIER